MRVKLLLLSGILMILSGGGIHAQDKSVHGIISDHIGPLFGAAVQIEGTIEGTTSDINGKYSLSVPENATIVVSVSDTRPRKSLLRADQS